MGGGEGGEREDDEGDHDGFAEISSKRESFGGNNATVGGGNESALVSGHGFDKAI